MKNLFFIFVLLFVSISCNTSKLSVTENLYSVSVNNVITVSTDTFTLSLVDSMTVTDNLPDYNKWVKTYFKDGSNNNVYQYSTLYDPETGMVYTVKCVNNMYIVMKRLTTSEKE